MVIAGAIQAPIVQAALIQEWSYLIQSGFSNYTPTTGTGSVTGNDISSLNPPPGDAGPYSTVLTWGTLGSGGQLSSLVVEDNVAPGTSSPDPSAPGPTPRTNLETDGEAQNGATITHNNFSITNFQNALTSTQLTSFITLESVLPPGVTVGPLEIVYQILFEETPNVADPCVVPGTACSDIFVAKLLTPGGPINLPDTIDTSLGVIDGYAYTLTLILAGLDDLTAAQCAAAGAAAGCQGFITEEGQVNYYTPQFLITAQSVEVPEPGTLGLMGALLTGFGLLQRSRRPRRS